MRVPCGARSAICGSNSRTRAPGVERRGRIRLVAVDGLDQRGTHRWNPFFPAQHIEEPCQAGVLRVLRPVVHDEQRCIDARGLGSRIEKHADACDEAPAAQLDRLDRACVGNRPEPAWCGVFGPLDHRLVAERARCSQWIRGVGREVAVGPDQVLEPVRVGTREGQPPRSAAPGKRRAGSWAHDVLSEEHLGEAVLGIGQREIDSVLSDAGRPQRFFFGRF